MKSPWSLKRVPKPAARTHTLRARVRRATAAIGFGAIGMIALSAGCATPPTAPELDRVREIAIVRVPATDPAERIVVRLPGDEQPADQPPLEKPSLVDSLPPLSPTPAGDDEAREIAGLVGDALKAGRFRVDLPPGAFDGIAAVRIAVADTMLLHCRLDIAPLSKNHFLRPVTLRVSLAGVAHPERMGIVWRYGATGEWSVAESRFDPGTGVLTTELEHFSEYAVSEVFRNKAGW
jgi:hypothetical protein